ncbi:hypothetical protein AAE478_005166 [Parahypoxylon ruwenzoriense]
MSIARRRGCFSNVKEDELLIEGFAKYYKAYKQQNTHDGWPTTKEDMELDSFAVQVDAAFGSRPYKKKNRLRFIQNDNALRMVEQLIWGFSQQCRPVPGKSCITSHKQGPLTREPRREVARRAVHSY